MKILIQNGRLLDPVSRIDQIMDLLIEDKKIIKRGENLAEKADKVIDASGCFVMPGLIDLHVHLRDPGLTHKEDIETGTRAAARGGVTTVCAMPNTKPVVDSKETLEYIYKKANEKGSARVLQLSAFTKGMEGKELVDIDEMVEAGAAAFSEDGKSVMDICLYEQALEKLAKRDMLVMAHCEDKDLVGKGVLNKGVASLKYNVPGIENAVEDIITARDIFLSNETGVRLHLCHCSTKGVVELIKMAKGMGIPVTGEVCPHHFILTDADIKEADGNYKMNPPLRKREDVDALIEGLRDGTIDAISTDHAPHHESEKGSDFTKCAFGIVGLETSASLTYTYLVKTGVLTPLQMAEKMSSNPAKILKREDLGSLEEGKTADILIFDPNIEYKIDKNEFASKAKNTPFDGMDVIGKVKMTIYEGNIVYEA
ncbi:MAG: dihydroorotase [Lachnospiraceae bacterium]